MRERQLGWQVAQQAFHSEWQQQGNVLQRQWQAAQEQLASLRQQQGRLAVQAWPARVATLLISDIPGDEAALIASAPTLPDASTCAQALAVLRRHGVALSAGLAAALACGALESPKPGDARFAGHTHAIVACAQDILEAAASLARDHGWLELIL